MLNIDVMLIAAYLSTSFVSIYVFTSKIAFLIGITLISKIPSAIFPGISILFEKKEKQKIIKIFQILTVICLRIGIVFGILYFLFNEEFINVWVGTEYYGGAKLTFIFTVWIIIESFNRGVISILFSSNQIVGWAFISFVEAIINLCLSIILIDTYGLFGIALATILSRISTTIIYVPIKICKILNYSYKRYVYDSIILTLILCIPSILAAIALDYILNSFNIIIKSPIIITVVISVNVYLFELRKLKLRNIKSVNELIMNIKSIY